MADKNTINSSGGLGSTVLTVVLVVCAIASTALVGYREFVQAPSGATQQTVSVSPQSWQELLALGEGADGGRVVLVTFADLQCPACRAFSSVLAAARTKFGAQVDFRIHHYPLPYHRFAQAAGEALECARSQGKLWEFHDAVYRQQDSVGVKSFSAYADEAGVPDSAAFESCVTSRRFMKRVEQDLSVARSLDLPGTPAILLEGRHVVAMDTVTLFRLLQREVERR